MHYYYYLNVFKLYRWERLEKDILVHTYCPIVDSVNVVTM